MERDFMGLNSKDTVVKEEAVEDYKEPDGFEALNNGEIQGTPSSPFFRPQFTGSPVKQQLLGTAPSSTSSFVAGTTGPWYSSKGASQLTIFYGGMVNVYDDISPQKARAIMFLAGNGASVASPNTPQPWAQAQAPNPTTPAVDASPPINAQPCSALSSPASVSSHPVGQPTGGPTNKDEAAKTMAMMRSAVPQARKASLARFLEKRKERVMASAPYSLSKSSPDCATTLGASNDAFVVANRSVE